MSEWDADKMRLQVARDLREIGSLYLDLWAEVVYAAADREMPGGDAMNLIGPVANLEAWEHRYEAAEARAVADDSKLPEYVEDQIDTEAHPLLVLATWEDVIREERDQPTDLKATVPRAIDYLRGSLDWMLRVNEYDEPAWLAVDALASDLRRVVNGLESVLSQGIRSDKGADCLTCGEPMIHIWAGGPWSPKRLQDDHWECRTCDVTIGYEPYMQAVKDEYLRRATWLQADHMLLQYEIPIGTLQGWASEAKGCIVRKRRNIHSGRMVYSVLDAVKRRDKGKVEEEAA